MALLTIQTSAAETVPVGTYPVSFSKFSELETSKGRAYRWEFKADDGRLISGLSDANGPPTTQNKTGRWLAALSGKPLTSGVAVNPDEYIGRRYFAIVAPNGNGGTKLETFSALPSV